jgi:hypothetical protein
MVVRHRMHKDIHNSKYDSAVEVQVPIPIAIHTEKPPKSQNKRTIHSNMCMTEDNDESCECEGGRVRK